MIIVLIITITIIIVTTMIGVTIIVIIIVMIIISITYIQTYSGFNRPKETLESWGTIIPGCRTKHL